MSVCFACSLYVVGNIFVGFQLDSMVAGSALLRNRAEVLKKNKN